MAIARSDASCSRSPKEHKTGHNQLSASVVRLSAAVREGSSRNMEKKNTRKRSEVDRALLLHRNENELEHARKWYRNEGFEGMGHRGIE